MSDDRPGAATGPWGRFDDVPAGRATSFAATAGVLVADRSQDVLPVLREVERATDRGLWAFGYVGYEAAAGLDPSWVVAEPSYDAMPLAWFGLAERTVPVEPVTPTVGERPYAVGRWQPGWTRAGYEQQVEQVRAHIAAGLTYQCNLTVRLRAAVSGDLARLYADLAGGQRGAYAAYLDLGRWAVASASPELFFSWTGDRLLTRPMKGTARRGRTPAEDRERARALVASEKERAENVMIVDLIRNDLGRVARTGTVEVPALFAAERYGTVWQLTSDVTATLRPDAGLVDVFRALFPSGSVTGAPKPRTMELIRDLEREPRGVYCGAVGVVAPRGQPERARFSVAIRTLTVDRRTGTGVYGTGGGITWSSDPAAEHAELLAKTAVLDVLTAAAPAPAG